MLDTKKIEKIVFCDIESVSQYPSFKDMPEKWQDLFKKRFKKEVAEIDENMPSDAADYAYEELYTAKAGLHAEFGKIVCISCGILKESAEGYDLKVVSYTNEDEVALLAAFIKGMNKVLDQPLHNPNYFMCFHGAFLFDIPYIGKRMLYNRMPVPKALDLSESKPWDIKHILCTNSLMKWGQFDGGVNLDLLAASLEVESSKTDMDGSMVKEVYWNDKDLNRIKEYCQADVRTLSECVLKIKGIYRKVTIK